jgi:hypothetical protein
VKGLVTPNTTCVAPAPPGDVSSVAELFFAGAEGRLFAVSVRQGPQAGDATAGAARVRRCVGMEVPDQISPLPEVP